MTTILKPSYTGSAPTASNTQVLFSTVAAGWPAKLTQMNGLELLLLDIVNSHSGTLKLYKSQDHGTSWKQVGERAVTAGTTNSNFLDFDISAYEDWKIEWVNGGTNQTTWVVDIALSSERFGIQSPDETFGADLTLWLEPYQALTPDDASVDSDLTTWTDTRLVTSGDGGSPEVYTLAEDASAATSHLLRGSSALSNIVSGKIRYTAEIKAVNRDWCALYLVGFDGGTFFNVSAGVVGSSFGNAPDDATITDIGSGWYRCSIDIDGSATESRIYLGEADADITFDGLSQDSIMVRNVSVTQRRIIGLADQGASGHDASQPIDASQSLYGPDALGAQKIADFDGTDDYMTLAAGSGWPAHTSHSIFLLANRRTLGTGWGTVLDAVSGRLILLLLDPVETDHVGFFDAASARRRFPSAKTGWGIWEWHLDSDAGVGTVIQTNGSTAASLGSAAYASTAIGGTVTIAGLSGGNWYDLQWGSMVIASRASGHVPGVTSEAERAAERNRLRRLAQNLGVAL